MSSDSKQKRADAGVRILSAATPHAISREIERVGCRDEGALIMAPKGLMRLVRLENVSTKAANILKQEMLSHGGDAAVNWKTISCELEYTDVLLIGNEAQLLEVCRHLRRQPFGLARTAEVVLETLKNFSAQERVLRCGNHTFPLGGKTYLMGIINVTPDSFSGDGVSTPDSALRQAERMLDEGADILDVGGESTRPGAEVISLEEELRRVIPAIRSMANLGVPISVDTYKSQVAREALAAGASIVNDISGLRFDAEMARIAAEGKAAVVVMHIKGTPRTMQQNPSYDDLMTEVCGSLQESTDIALAAGIARQQVILDPGFGFGKTVEHNLELIRRLRELSSYGQPVLLGTSRKSTIGKLLGDLPPEERLEGTAATIAVGIANGADIVRVHDVKQMARVVKMTDAIVRK